MSAKHPAFDEFVETIAALRAPDGCPWDKAQTHESIAKSMIEEAYEAVDAIEAHDAGHLREELGDVLLQVVLQSQIAADDGEFTIDDVCADINDKMIRRHPHVFGEMQADDANEVRDLWEQVKLAEKEAKEAKAAEKIKEAAADGVQTAQTAQTAQPEGLLASVPRTFPSLLEAQKISRKAVAVGFEWATLDDVWAQVEEEIAELKEAYAAAPKSANGQILEKAGEDDAPLRAAELELGDVLFALVNVARRMGLDAESALRATNTKFRARWSTMEDAAWGQGVAIEELSTAELNHLWDEAKVQLDAASRA